MSGSLERLNAALTGRYRVERELGAGGMATVYLADDLRHERKVAIKVLRQDLAASLGAERFHREIKIAAALQHPHILPLYDSGDADGLLFYVMPYVEGTSLRQKITKERELPVVEAVRILRDVADALGAAHERGVVHRDLKPENVMLSGRHALVADFGVAKALSEATGRQALTTLGVALGTPTYMAPEQATADPHLDHRADIYAFGVMAYELLAGRPPFTGLSPQEILAAHVTAAAPPVTTLRAAIPPVLSTLVMRCLEKRPADRWQRADELLSQLESVLTPSGGLTPTDTRPLEAASPAIVQRRRWPMISAAVAGVAGLTTIAAVALRGRDVPLDPARVLVVPFEIPAAREDLTALQQRLESAIVRGLQRTGLGTVSDSRTAIGESGFRDTTSAALATASVGRRLAHDIGAGLVLIGRILPAGDSVQVSARLLKTENGTEVIPIPAIVGDVGGSSAFVDAVAQRLMGALAIHRDPAWGSSLPGASAPAYAAYRAYAQANEAWSRRQFLEAGEGYRKAYVLDTTFLAAAIRRGYALFNAQDFAGVDSLGAVLEPRRVMMSPFEVQYLNRLLAWTHGDLQGVYTAARAMARQAPESNVSRYTAARSALFVNRLAEAKEGLLSVDIDSPDMAGIDGSYSDICEVLHLLRDHEAELETAKAWRSHARSLQPARAAGCEANALAALGRLQALEALFPRLLTPEVGAASNSVVYAVRLINELRFHGHDSAATRLSRNAVDRVGDAIPVTERLELLTRAGELSRATALADSVLLQDPAAVGVLIWSGLIAVARQDTAAAHAVLARLERINRPYQAGAVTRGRARIRAALGEKDVAVQLLQKAFSEGASFQLSGGGFHIGFESLRGFPAYEAFIKPR